MPEQDAPYDPYIPSGQSAPQQGAGGNDRTQALQAVSRHAHRRPTMGRVARGDQAG